LDGDEFGVVGASPTINSTIAQGFAHHVNNNAEALRSRLVGFQGRMVLQVNRYKLEGPEDWAEVIDEWAEDIGDFIPPELSQTLRGDTLRRHGSPVAYQAEQ
jgi:Domain of unknown function (DUF4419)